jgi:hypothetical protein
MSWESAGRTLVRRQNLIADPRRLSKSIELAERKFGLHYSGHSGALGRRQGLYKHVLFVCFTTVAIQAEKQEKPQRGLLL